jgi:hypothetical protein
MQSNMPKWISVEEASELSGYSSEYVRRLLRASQIAAEKKGRDWWVDHGSLVHYLREAGKSGDRRRGPNRGKHNQDPA